MFSHIKNRSVSINGTTMHYVEFGRGETPLIILPGLSDGLQTVKGQAIRLAFYFREYLKDFQVYVFSRKENLMPGCTIQDMADDLKAAIDQIGIKQTYLIGVSQGGMVAQCFAIRYPDKAKKLVLAVTACRANDTLRHVLHTWMEYAQKGAYPSLMIDTLEKTYSARKLKTYRFLYPIISRMGKPKDFGRFFIQANAVLAHDTHRILEQITCPTFIVGGDQDQVLGPDASPEMAEKIPDSRLLIYNGLGHAAYEEGRDFNRQVKNFLLNGSAL